jgi:hypothetical protein
MLALDVYIVTFCSKADIAMCGSPNNFEEFARNTAQ